VVVGGETGADRVAAAARAIGLPVFRAALTADARTIAELSGMRVLAFAGIGDPAKLFATLERAGISVAATRAFADHHPYTPQEAEMLCSEADRASLTLVTTEKDLVRVAGEPALAQLAARACALPVKLALSDEDGFLRLMRAKLQA
jgi:tetraacyldisaccharide 4'-kinase